MSALRGWLFPPVPLARVALLRPVIYLFVVFDLFLITGDVIPHASDQPGLYGPLLMRRLLHLPTPDPLYAHTLRIVIIVAALVAASGRFPRLAGYVVAAGFTDWVSIAFSYAKVDHDHFALIVAVWVLPTVGAARIRAPQGDRRSEAAGWALKAIQLGVVCTYFFSAVAKVRIGGWDWPTGSTFAWAMVRRGTWLGRHVLEPSWLLTSGQFAVITAETLSVGLLFLRGRWRYAGVAVFALFHLSTYLLLSIHFLPLVVCLLAFLPLEDWRRRRPDDARDEPAAGSSAGSTVGSTVGSTAVPGPGGAGAS